MRIVRQLPLQRRRQLERVLPADAQPHRLAVAHDRQIVQIHRRAADKLGDETVGGVVIQVDRFIHLHDGAAVHHANAIAHGHRLDLIVW